MGSRDMKVLSFLFCRDAETQDETVACHLSFIVNLCKLVYTQTLVKLNVESKMNRYMSNVKSSVTY